MPTVGTMNIHRAARAFSAVQQYAGAPDEVGSPEENVQDLLTDLRHYCSTIGADFSALSRRAKMIYLEELEDESL